MGQVYYVYADYDFCNTYLAHHGIKGMRWGVRRWQYDDGSLTPAGEQRYYDGSRGNIKSAIGAKIGYTKAVLTRNSKKDRVLPKDVTLSRIQKEPEFEKGYAFYTTYMKDDKKKYTGLFVQNIRRRYKTDSYSLELKSNKDLKIASKDTCKKEMSDLLKNEAFRDLYYQSIQDSASKMRRPQQQKVFYKALNDLKKKKYGSDSIYEAFNLSLTNHEDFENKASEMFYGRLKKKGYHAIDDINDKKYSSYKAKSPLIVFDTSSISVQSISDIKYSDIKGLSRKYNTERYIRELLNGAEAARSATLAEYYKSLTRNDYYY